VRRYYAHFSYHDVSYGNICVFFNLSVTDHTIVAGDHTGYTLGHIYAPTETCSDAITTPGTQCGDAVTGGLASSQCSSGPCLGNLNAATFADNSTVVPKNGGVVVGTP
jgi:hypothetical protein